MGLNLMTLLLYGALGGFMVMLPFLLIEAGGYSATLAGAALLPFPLVMTAGGPLTGALAGRFGARWLLAGGSLIVGVSFLLMLRIGVHAPYWTQVAPCVLVMALGMTGVAAPLTTAVLSSVDDDHRGAASGLNSALSRTGGLLATALLGFALASRGQMLITNFHLAAMVGAGLSAVAGACAFIGLADR
jgi:MFS family permease